jgi:hypothetical protein
MIQKLCFATWNANRVIMIQWAFYGRAKRARNRVREILKELVLLQNLAEERAEQLTVQQKTERQQQHLLLDHPVIQMAERQQQLPGKKY